MRSEFDPKLESLVHEELRKLPPLKAPDTLAPRVLAAIKQRAARPWWQQDWGQWPFAAKILLVALALLLVAGLTGSGWFIDAQFSGCLQQVSQGCQALWTSVSPWANSGLLLWSKIFQSTALIYGLAFLALLYVSCLGAGTLFVRLTFNRN